MLIKPSWLENEPDNRSDMEKIQAQLETMQHVISRIDNNLDQLRNVCFHTAQTTENFTDRLQNFFETCERK